MVEIDDIEKAVRQVNQAVDRELTGKTGALIIQRMIRYARDVAVYDTGEMRNRITPTVARMADSDTVEYKAIAQAPHSIFVEYGTGAKGDPEVPHRMDWEHPMEPKPFMRPAIGIDAGHGVPPIDLDEYGQIIAGNIKRVFE
jgi:hypothetical protein